MSITQSFSVVFNSSSSSVLSLIAGPFEDQVLAIWGPNRVHEYLSAPDGRRHIWHSWLAKRPEATPDMYRTLSLAKSRRIISDGFGHCPDGMIGALSRLGPQARSAEFYLTLYSVLDRGGAMAKVIHHRRTIKDDLVLALSGLEDDDLSQRSVARLSRTSVSPRWFGALIWTIRRIQVVAPVKDEENLILKSAKPIATANELIAELPFPSSPWGATGKLMPVDNSGSLADLGKQFRNCLEDKRRWIEAAKSVQAGQNYYYHWAGEQPALLLFIRCGAMGWALREAEGVGGAELTSETDQEIREILRLIPEICPCDPQSSAATLFDFF